MRFTTIVCICLAFGATPPARTQTASPSGHGSNSSSAPSTGAGQSPAKTENPASTPAGKKNTGSSAARKGSHHRKSKQNAAKVVVPNGSTAEPSVHFSTTVSPEQASRERDKTAGLLATTNSNLEKISAQPLNPAQEDTVKQIHGYMTEAKTAEASGDLESAHNLALKAQLLSSELVGK